MVRDQTEVTLVEWQSRPELVKIARKFLDDPQFKLMVDVLRTSHFQNAMMRLVGTTVEDRAAMQARSEGYTVCLNNLRALGEFHEPSSEIEPTFEPEDVELETEETT